MNKSIIIALGGTGTAVVERLRKRLKIYAGTDTPADCRFIYVDTDVMNNPIFRDRPGEACRMTLDSSAVADCRNDTSALARRINISRWMDRERRERLTPLNSGADGVRSNGRLALLAGTDLAKLMDMIRQAIGTLLAGTHQGSDVALRVFVVASAGGGSGSGFFIDMGYLTRMLLPDQGSWEQVGIVAVAPNDFTLVQGAPAGTKQNSAALLDEMDHFSRPNIVFTANYNGTELPERYGVDRPYQHCYLVSPMAGGGALDKRSDRAVDMMIQRTANWIFMRLVGPGEIGSRQSDFTTNYAARTLDGQGFPNAFSTFGASVRLFPSFKYKEESVGKAIMRVADVWLKLSIQDAALTPLWSAELNQLISELGLPPDYIRNNKEKRVLNDDSLYKKLIAPRVQTTQQTPPSPLDMVKAATDTAGVNALFHYQPGSPVSPDLSGYFSGTVRNNQADFSTAFEKRLTLLLRDIAFDFTKGPRVARLLAAALQALLDAELQFLEQCLTNLNSTTSAGGGTRTKRKVDPVLGPWQSTLKGKTTVVTASPTLNIDKNRRIEIEILNAKQKVYQGVQTIIALALDRLNTLETYVTAWKVTWGGQADTRWRSECGDGIVLADELVEEKIARFSVVPNKSELDAIMRLYLADDFVTNPPNTRDRRQRYTVFGPLENRIKEAIESDERPDGSRVATVETIAGESVIRAMDIQNGHTWWNDAQQSTTDSYAMITEAWPLLRLNLADPDYQGLLPPNPNGFPNSVEHYWCINQNGADEESNERFQQAVVNHCSTVNNQGHTPIVRHIERLEHDIEAGVAGIVYLRGAFSSRIILGMTPDDRRQLLGNNARRHYSRSDVLGGVTPEELVKAKARLLLLDTLRLYRSTPQGLTIEVDGEHFNITYHDTRSAVNGYVDARRWETAAHEIAVAGDLPTKIDEVLREYLQNPLHRGVVIGAIAELRAAVNRNIAGHSTPLGLTWRLEPTQILNVLNDLEAEYALTLKDAQVKEARKLLLVMLTLVNDPQLPDALKKAAENQNMLHRGQTLELPKHDSTRDSHTFSYNETIVGFPLPQPREIKLSKMDPNVAARTLAGNHIALEELSRIWNGLQNMPGGTANIANALLNMIVVLQNLNVQDYCQQLDMFGLESRIDRPLLCEATEPIVPEDMHPWAIKNDKGNWECNECHFQLGREKPGLMEGCANQRCRHFAHSTGAV